MEINLSLVLQEPIVLNHIKIYQPTIEDICNYGIDKFNNLLMPFIIDKNTLRLDSSDYDGIAMFDLFIFDNSPLQESLLDSIDFFCRSTEQNIRIDMEERKIKIGDGYLDRNNFEEFGNIILKICSHDKSEEDKQAQKFKGKAKLAYEKLHKYREKQKSKNQLYLWDMIKVVEIGGQSYIPISQIKKMTMWKLTDLYKSILVKKGYEDNFEVFLVTGDKKVIEEHWTDRIKLDNNGGKN